MSYELVENRGVSNDSPKEKTNTETRQSFSSSPANAAADISLRSGHPQPVSSSLPYTGSVRSFPAQETLGETALWRAVITQALMDAGSHSGREEIRTARKRAIAWLNGDSEDFHYVCYLAGLDPEYVKRKVQYAIAQGCVWRNDAKLKALKAQLRDKEAVEPQCIKEVDAA